MISFLAFWFFGSSLLTIYFQHWVNSPLFPWLALSFDACLCKGKVHVWMFWSLMRKAFLIFYWKKFVRFFLHIGHLEDSCLGIFHRMENIVQEFLDFPVWLRRCFTLDWDEYWRIHGLSRLTHMTLIFSFVWEKKEGVLYGCFGAKIVCFFHMQEKNKKKQTKLLGWLGPRWLSRFDPNRAASRSSLTWAPSRFEE